MLMERAIPFVAFAVSGHLGGTNDWDKAIGASPLQSLDGNGLRRLAREGGEIGAHPRTHRLLTHVAVEELSNEITGSVADLEAVGLNHPRLFAYPYGEWSERVLQAVQEAGLQAAFTVDPDLVGPGQNPYRVSRIEVLRRGCRMEAPLESRRSRAFEVSVEKALIAAPMAVVFL